jgi:hypothetical protein
MPTYAVFQLYLWRYKQIIFSRVAMNLFSAYDFVISDWAVCI